MLNGVLEVQAPKAQYPPYQGQILAVIMGNGDSIAIFKIIVIEFIDRCDGWGVFKQTKQSQAGMYSNING